MRKACTLPIRLLIKRILSCNRRMRLKTRVCDTVNAEDRIGGRNYS
jgi:hypothetical protein